MHFFFMYCVPLSSSAMYYSFCLKKFSFSQENKKKLLVLCQSPAVQCPVWQYKSVVFRVPFKLQLAVEALSMGVF